jgi:hypothetical protein
LKTKIVGIVVCTLLIATTLVSAINVNQKSITPTLFIADVPIWEVGDSWTYEIEKTTRSDPNETMAYTLAGDLILSVKSDAGDYYTLEGIGESISILGNIGSLGLKSSRIITVESNIVIRKSDLAVSSYYFMFKGIAFIMLGPIIIPFPVQVQVYRDSEFIPEKSIFPFPLHDGKNGTFDKVLIEEDWATSMFWGLITADSGNNTWHSTFNNYTCTAEQITVPAGTYNVYNVSNFNPAGDKHNHIELYYNASAGNAVEISFTMYHGDWHDWWLIQKLRLKSSTYSP